MKFSDISQCFELPGNMSLLAFKLPALCSRQGLRCAITAWNLPARNISTTSVLAEKEQTEDPLCEELYEKWHRK